jgi:hypothetical protein
MGFCRISGLFHLHADAMQTLRTPVRMIPVQTDWAAGLEIILEFFHLEASSLCAVCT